MSTTTSRRRSASRSLLIAAATIVVVVALVAVRSCATAPPASGGAGGASTPPVELADNTAAEKAVVSFSAIVLEFDPGARAGQGFLAALGVGEDREGVLSADGLSAVRDLLPSVTVLTQPGVTAFAGQQCVIGTDATTTAPSGQVVAKQEIKLGLIAEVVDESRLTVAARFYTVDANGRLAVLAEEWGLPFAKRRSASASETIRPDEALFMRRRFGGKELLVIVMGRRMPAAGPGQSGGEGGPERDDERDDAPGTAGAPTDGGDE